jgi:hypothetical protein
MQGEQSAEVDAIHRELYSKDEFSEPLLTTGSVESRAILYIKDHVRSPRPLALPDAAWFHCAKYLCEIHSILSNKNLPNGITPKQFRTGVHNRHFAMAAIQFTRKAILLP